MIIINVLTTRKKERGMNNFQFYNPVRIVFGAGELKQIGSEAAAVGKKALLVSYADYGFMKETLDKVVALCKEKGVEVVPFYAAVANPLMSDIEAGVKVARAKKVDMIIGCGGGSVMDTAKLIAAGTLYSNATVPPDKALPILLINTLPATSSEMNCGAVATNTETMEKTYLFHPCIYPKVSILDPELTTSLPTYQTACGVVDSLSHVIEIYFTCQNEIPVQDRLMEGIMSSQMDHVAKILKDPKNVALRGDLMWEVALSWNGWILPGTGGFTPMHMIAHAMSARWGVTHGASLGIVMPAFMKKTWKVNPERYIQFGQRVFGKKMTPLQVIAKFEKFISGLGVQTRLTQCKGIPENHKKVVKTLLDDSVRVYFGANGKLASLKPLTKKDVQEIIELGM
jgi:alcohol dehydrogenase YqhD (iron-dependent ADH family)